MLASCPELSEQAGEQRNQDDADQGDAAARHELFHALTFRAGVVVAVTFQQVDRTPDTETGTQSDDEGLKDPNSRVEKCHTMILPLTNGCPATVSVSSSPFKNDDLKGGHCCLYQGESI